MRTGGGVLAVASAVDPIALARLVLDLKIVAHRRQFGVAFPPFAKDALRTIGAHHGVKTRKCMNCPARVNELATQAASIESRRRSGRNEPPVG